MIRLPIAILLGDDAGLYRHLVAKPNPIPMKPKPTSMFHEPIEGIGYSV